MRLRARRAPQGAPQRIQRVEVHGDAAGLVRQPQVAGPKQLLGQAQRVLQLASQPIKLGILCAQTMQVTCLSYDKIEEVLKQTSWLSDYSAAAPPCMPTA